MILDGYWKKELKHNIHILKLWMKLSKAFHDYAKHQINKSVLYSAVIIRKMFEDEKDAELELKKTTLPMPPLKLLKYKVKVRVYPFFGDERFIVERVIPENYDYKNAAIKDIELNKLCNQIIHSFVWSLAYDQDLKKIKSVLFASDKAKEDVLYLLELKEFIKAIDFCIENGNI